MTFDAVVFLTELFRTCGRREGHQPPNPSPEEAPLPGGAAGLPAEWHFAWDERAAILEHDAGLPRERAEAAALRDVLGQMRRAGALR